MPRSKIDDLKSCLLHLYGESVEQQKAKTRDPLDPVELQVPWPYVLYYPSAIRLDDPEKTKREIVWRLKNFHYPYPEGNKAHKTFYKHIKSLGLLNLLLTPPLLWSIRSVWFDQQSHKLESKWKSERHSVHNLPIAYHRALLHLLFDHIRRIDRVGEKFEVSNQEWLRDYYVALQKQLLREGASYYPQFRRTFKPSHRLRVWSHEVENQLELYFALLESFGSVRPKSKKLARQVTAVLCSGPECIRNKTLNPDPERVRKYIGDFDSKHPKQKNKMDKTRR